MKLIGPNKEWCRARRPFTGAWIETGMGYVFPGDRWVAPSRGRGLKLVGGTIARDPLESPLHGGVD